MKRNFKKGISAIVALAMTLTSASVVFADSELVTSVKYKDGFVTVTGSTDSANEAVDVFLLNPGETKVDLGAANTTAEYNETVNFSDVIYSDAAKDFEITFEINNQNDEESYLLYVKTESGDEYSETVAFNNIYVAATGDDTNGTGTKTNPYATIARAQTAARAITNSFATNVIIGEGEYAATSTLEFTSDDSGTDAAPVTYKAADGAKVVVSGATQITMDKISSLTEAEDSAVIARLPEAVANKVVKIDLSHLDDAIVKYSDNWSGGKRLLPMGVYLNDDQQDISRWPNTGYTTISATSTKGANNRYPNDENAGTYAQIIVNGLGYDKAGSWKNLDDVFVDGYLGVDWYVDSAKIASVTDNGSFVPNTYEASILDQLLGNDGSVTGTVLQLASYPTQYGIVSGGRVVLKNILEEIDSPGEWYVDKDTKTMYYYPPHTLTSADTLEIATFSAPFVNAASVENFTIEGITFEKNANASTSNHGIKVNKGDNVTIKSCTMTDLGAWGIYHSSTSNFTVDGCVMNNLGLGGIYTSSGDTTNLTSANAVVKNCHISDIARDYQANSVAAVQVAGCGTTIKNNTFHNMKNSAIRYAGQKHLFKENEIFNAVNDSSDAGAIYSGRSYVNYGTKILNNYLYHIGGGEKASSYPVAGIYWDDNQSGETAIGNIVVVDSTAEGAMAMYVAGGADIVATDNILVSVSGVEPTKTTAHSTRTGPYAIRVGRGTIASEITGGTYYKTEAFTTYKNATTLNAYEKDTDGNYVYDYDEDGSISFSDIGQMLLNNTDKSNWHNAYLTEFDGKIRSMFELIVNKTFARRSTYNNNFCYGTVDKFDTEMLYENDNTQSYTESNTVELSAFAQTNKSDFRLKDANGTAAITSATPLSTFGAQDYEIADEEKEFDLVFPAKKATVLGTSTYIKWEKVNVADEYNYVVYKSTDLSNPVAEGTTTDTMVELTELDADTTYCWSVEAVNLSFNIGGTYACSEEGEFTTATYEFTNPAYDATTTNITVDYVNAGTAAIEDINFIAAVKVGGVLKSSVVSVQDAFVTDGNTATITIPASTLTNLEDEGAVLELYIWDNGMKSLTGKMLLDI